MNAQIWHWAASPPNSGWPWPHSSTSQSDGLWGDYPITDELAQLIWEKTAGVQRLIIALWIAAHRVAFEKKTDELLLEDFQIAADTYLSLVQPAVVALCSNDPQRLRRYEDLVPRDNTFWTRFWGDVSSF